MQDSKFNDDLSHEAFLSQYLDKIYPEVFKDTEFKIRRTPDIKNQLNGVDLILQNSEKVFFVDEKAQLDYVNRCLPTFAFELSYLKDKSWRKGWMYDKSKKTDIYFLITNIHFTKGQKVNRLSKIKITGVYRNLLTTFLKNRGLSEDKLFRIERELRQNGKHGRYPIKELNPKTEGVLFFSKQNKNEQPINLVLKLDFLLKENLGKIIYQK